MESEINALVMLQQLTKSSSDRTGRSVSNYLHSERARDMSALLHLFKLLPDRDRIAAACVCKVAEEQLGCLLAHSDFVTLWQISCLHCLGVEWGIKTPFFMVYLGPAQLSTC